MKILIIGAGAYGLALSTILSDKNEVTVYSSLKEEIDNLNKINKNKKIKYINNTKNTDVETVIIALPSKIIKQELEKIKDILTNKKIIIASKGISEKKFVHQIVKEIINTDKLYILSGPSFAEDTIKRQIIILTLAGKNTSKIKKIFNEQYIKIEETEDIIGTEICGALKNIYAIGSGMLKGLNASESTKAAFLTRIINDTQKVIKMFDGNPNTILLSCGIGDILLTCSSEKSRNFTLGYMIGKNTSKKQIKEYINTTTIEGLTSLTEFKNILSMCEKNIEIINLLYDIIHNGKNPKQVLSYILK